MFNYFAGVVICLFGIQQLAIYLWAGRELLRQGDFSSGVATLRIGGTRGGGLLIFGAQFVLAGYWGEHRSFVPMAVGGILIVVSIALSLIRLIQGRATHKS